AQDWEWVKGFDVVEGRQDARKICFNQQHIYVLAYQDGKSKIINTTLDTGYFILKYDIDGNFIWGKNYSGIIEDITTDNNSNFYLVGLFTVQLSFNSISILSLGSSDAFLAKFNPEGDCIWAKPIGNDENKEIASSVGVDIKGNIYFGGQIFGDYLIENNTINNDKKSWAYLIKLDKNGEFIWHLNDSINNHNGAKIKVGPDNYIFLSSYSTLSTLEPGCYAYCGKNIIFKIKPSGEEIQIIQFSFTWASVDFISYNSKITSLNMKTRYNYGDRSIYDQLSNGTSNLRKDVGKYYNGYYTNFITAQNEEDIIISGAIKKNVYMNFDTVYFDSHYIVPDTMERLLLAGISKDNKFQWAITSEGDGCNKITDIISDRKGNSYVIGNYNRTDYYCTEGNRNLVLGSFKLNTSDTLQRLFFAKLTTPYKGETTPIISETKIIPLTLNPNPTSSHFTLSFEAEKADVTITDFSGRIMLQRQVKSNENISTSGFSKGIYFVQVKVGEEVVRRKLVIN
ncbi:MAG TPA: T9SS type A sorting domain-containing protein, partial [Bacteroidia bacterium]|nr:T9SS type A sorting domain-containing protein [Bacteroidia bacterium]